MSQASQTSGASQSQLIGKCTEIASFALFLWCFDDHAGLKVVRDEATSGSAVVLVALPSYVGSLEAMPGHVAVIEAVRKPPGTAEGATQPVVHDIPRRR